MIYLDMILLWRVNMTPNCQEQLMRFDSRNWPFPTYRKMLMFDQQYELFPTYSKSSDDFENMVTKTWKISIKDSLIVK